MGIFEEPIYTKIIFEIFVEIQPTLKNTQLNIIEPWDMVFGNDFNKLNHNKKNVLLNLIESDGSYQLPSEYYNTVDKHDLILVEDIIKKIKKQGYKNPTKEQIQAVFKALYEREPKI